ncbi:MAG: hypothetical protein IT179_09705 [Acidobacteria bacterium]|nr:hypothetical protein [Acidobacteriota bacterium]
MADTGPVPSPCPTAEDLAAFCWRHVPETSRAAVLLHLSQCVACRTRAAQMMADAPSDDKPPPRGGDA